MKLLNKIQKELKAPKKQHNSFGNYDYRSCEDILEAIKPLLGEAVLVLTDEIVLIGDRYYVKAIARLDDGEKSIAAFGFARESLEKKGMDTAQITGAASSYARKYALSGLFCIDDNKDADTTNGSSNGEKIGEKELSFLRDNLADLEASEPQFLKFMKLEKLEDMLITDYQKAVAAIETKRKQKASKK